MITEIKKNKKSKKEALYPVIIVVLFVGLIFFLIFTNVRISRKRAEQLRQIEELEKEIEILERKKEQLGGDISQAGTEEYLEKVARQDLGMKSPGEEVVVISREEEEFDFEDSATEDNSGFWQSIWAWLLRD